MMEIQNNGPSCEIDKSCCGGEQMEAKLNEPSCTFTPSEMPDRMARWHRLFAENLGHKVGEVEAVFRFVNTSEIKTELQELIKLEKICCANVTWQVAEVGNEISLKLIADAGSIRPLVDGLLPLITNQTGVQHEK